ncbi:DUF1489 domain-containing protein [Paralimibaculum aggregatum]|uniref:DUF1489 domain-containing protein n=1 Tax=Paralimibaculum aggregatum TaxID=3036245 RepID=A0ABQ6LS72_9RHOB|nr:DUF1489 domain-containing protein [Limibaculum sp. NKW23]GMG84914.1 DUF1489 domain-containing protein [Limibaculum sp. NKW23]
MADGTVSGSGDGGASGGRLHLLKLCVGTDSVADLADWQRKRAAERRRQGARACPVHVTRMWPRREAELLAGGSLYWVVRGVIAVRQRILALEAVIGDDGIRRCAIVLDPELIRTEGRGCRPFQGWRYLGAGDAPADLGAAAAAEGDLPAGLQSALAEFGLRAR